MDPAPIQYATTSDGFSIAYTVTGEGLPFVFMPAGPSHVQLDRERHSQIYAWLEALEARFRLIHYDGRGQGMSSRGLGADYSMSALERDIEAVVDHLRLERFILMGSHPYGHAAISYSIHHAERVLGLVLGPGGSSGAAWPIIGARELAATNWEFFATLLLQEHPALTSESRLPIIDNFLQSVTQADWLIMARVWSASNIEWALSSVRTPTLILHPRGYRNVPSSASIKLASQIPNAELALTEGSLFFGDANSGIPVIEDFLNRVSQAEQQQSAPTREWPSLALSAREIEVLQLIVQGKSNQQIADELVISLNTVFRHVSNIFSKMGVANRTEAAAFAHRHGLT